MSAPLSELDIPWGRLFPAADYRLHMGLHRGDASAFWSDWDGSGTWAADRALWLKNQPHLYSGCLSGQECLAKEAKNHMQCWSTSAEPDWVVLSATEPSVVVAGEVVFPSSWSLEEKLGQPLPSVHAPVPGLEEQLGTSIQRFLNRVEVGQCWERENWGLSASECRNQHPVQGRFSLAPDQALDQTYLRLEFQSIQRLPVSGALLFGIRVLSLNLATLLFELPELLQPMVRAVKTMPEPLAHYKGLSLARAGLISQMDSFHRPSHSGQA